MRVAPVDLDACGSYNFQPLINILRPDEPTVIDDIKGESVDITNPAKLFLNTITNRIRDLEVSHAKANRFSIAEE
jgi:hypothetical protein